MRMVIMIMMDKREMGWRYVLAFFLFVFSSCFATLVWQPPFAVRKMLHNVNYITTCVVISSNPRGSPLTYPDIYFKNKKLVSDSNHIITRDPSASRVTLEVKVMETADFGIYTCKEPASGFFIQQAVLSEMSVSVPNSVCLMTIGTNSTADTGIMGIPTPGHHLYIVRKRDANRGMKLVAQMNPISGVMEVGSGKYYINPRNGQFSISPVQQSDNGEYRLIVMANLTFVIDVVGKIFQVRTGNRPNITTPPSKSYTLISGVPAILKCEFKGRAGLLSYFWEQKTKSGASTTISKGSSGALSLIGTDLRIVPTVANIGDTFTCTGRNEFGENKVMTTIHMVYVKPTARMMGDSDLRIVLGLTVVATCKATGKPTPVVTWLKREADGTFRNVSGQVKSAGKSVIEINSTVLIEEMPFYKCIAIIAQNPDLRDETNMSVTVLRPPQFDKEVSTSVKAYPKGNALTQRLVCIASGFPRPAIKFMKESTELKGAMFKPNGKTLNATLHYMANVTEDFGKILCVAENSIGTARHDIDVVVVVRPAQPIGFTVVKVDSTFVELKWSSVSGAANYKVYLNDSFVKLVASNSVKVRHLPKGVTCVFYVKASNIAGDSQKSLQVQVTTLLYDKPGTICFNRDGPPKSFWTSDIELSWLKPAHAPNGPIIMYEVKYCPKFNGTYPVALCEVTLTNSTTISLKGLKEWTMYLFTIRAKNKGRTGDEFKFEAITGVHEDQPGAKPIRIEIGPRGGALIGYIVVAILVWWFVIDVACWFFMDRGLMSYVYKNCCVFLGKERFNENADFIELRDQDDNKPER